MLLLILFLWIIITEGGGLFLLIIWPGPIVFAHENTNTTIQSILVFIAIALMLVGIIQLWSVAVWAEEKFSKKKTTRY